MKGFVTKYYEQKFNLLADISESPFEDLFSYIAHIVNTDFAKRSIKDKKYISFSKLYYDCIYNYTHQKLSKIFKDQVLKFIFTDYVQSGDAYERLIVDETQSKNKEMYEETVSLFLRSFELGSYILGKTMKRRTKPRNFS